MGSCCCDTSVQRRQSKMKSSISVAMVAILVGMITNTNCAPGKMLSETNMEKFSDVAMNGTNGHLDDFKEFIKEMAEPCIRTFHECRKRHGIIGRAVCDAKLPVCVLNSIGCGVMEVPLSVVCLPVILVNPMEFGKMMDECVCKIEKLSICPFVPRVKEYCKSVQG